MTLLELTVGRTLVAQGNTDLCGEFSEYLSTDLCGISATFPRKWELCLPWCELSIGCPSTGAGSAFLASNQYDPVVFFVCLCSLITISYH